MNLFELFVKIGVDDQASGKLKTISDKLGNGLKTAAKIGTAAVGVAASGITALTTAAVKSYAEYEQLVGGAELMFGEAFETVMENAKNAYETVQMSQNEYLQQVNGFATGLKTALGGNEQAAAALAHKIIQAEADIVAATGNTAENVQNAFNGIMKSNFTMLDNLQIGIEPTKEGFQEVIDKVNEWNTEMGNATDYQMGNLADMQSALVDYIDMVGMSGYAQSEAAGTISGSLASLKASWSNLLTSLANGNSDYDESLQNLLDSAETFAENVIPVVGQVLSTLSSLIAEELQKLPGVVSSALEEVYNTLVEKYPMIGDFFESLKSIFDSVKEKVDEVFPEVKQNLVDSFTEIQTALQPVIDFFSDLYDELVNYVSEGQLAADTTKAIEKTIEFLGNTISAVAKFLADLTTGIRKFADFLTSGSTQASVFLSSLAGLAAMIVTFTLATNAATIAAKATTAAMIIMEGVQKGVAAAQALLNAVMNANPFVLIVTLIAGLVAAIITLWNTNEGFRNAIISAWEAIKSAATTIFNAVASFFTETIPNAFNSVVDWFKNVGETFSEIGKNIIDGIKKGISNAWNNLKEWFSGLFEDLIGIAKKILGIKSPSRVFRDQIGKQMAAGLGLGWAEEFENVKKEIEDSLDFPNATIGISTSIGSASHSGFGNEWMYGRGVNVVQNIYSEAKTAADLMEEAIYMQERAVMLGV